MGTFDASVRILVCSNCGASLPPVGPEGGSVQCAFCNHASFVGVRDDGSISSGQPVDEAARIASLWRQVDTGFNVHAEVTQLGEHGQLTERNVESARQQWEAARAIAADPAQAASIGDDLMWLTTLLVGYWAGQGDRQRIRALWESTLEASQGPRQRQFSRCALCRLSVNDGDLDDAISWLRPCDPQPSDLCSDSSYRLSYAYLTSVQGQFDQALQALGRTPNELPWFFSVKMLAYVTRANALEKSGDVAGAAQQLRDLAASSPDAAFVVPGMREANPVLDLCPQTIPMVFG